MKNSANGNMYEATPEATRELFDGFLSGGRSALICAVSGKALEEGARRALENSAAALGYGAGSCAFVALESADAELDGQALFLLLEGLDPLCAVAADERAAQALGCAYRCEVPLDAPVRLFGRDAVAFRDFPSLLNDPQKKQVAWALLKKLPKFEGR